MKIEWNKVTWYSKWLALALFVMLPFIGFYYGTQYGKTVAVIDQNTTVSTSNAGTAYYNNPLEWQTDANNKGFSIAYPIDFDTQDNYSATPSTDWHLNAGSIPGIKYFTLIIPRAFEPQTNFADATLTIGASSNAQAVATCMGTGEGTTMSTTTVNNIPFTVFMWFDAGAGNSYKTTSYRTIHA
jgi:hypothetical protein